MHTWLSRAVSHRRKTLRGGVLPDKAGSICRGTVDSPLGREPFEEESNKRGVGRGLLLRAASLVEYVLVLSCVSLVICLAGPPVADAIQGQFGQVQEVIKNGSTGGSGGGGGDFPGGGSGDEQGDGGENPDKPGGGDTGGGTDPEKPGGGNTGGDTGGDPKPEEKRLEGSIELSPAVVGKVATATANGAQNDAVPGYEWSVEGKTVSTGATWVPSAEYAGKDVTVTAADTGGTYTGSISADAVVEQAELTGSIEVAPGEAGVESTAAVDGAPSDADIELAWKVDGAAIGTGDAVTLPDDSEGKTLVVEGRDKSGIYGGVISISLVIKAAPKVAEAFAVFSADDGSLNFYKRVDVPAAGSQFEGKTVTEVYTGFEDKAYDQVWTGTNTCVPWADVCSKVTNATFVDTIQPNNMAWWFHAMTKLTSVDFTKLDASQCVSFKRMFSGDDNMVNFIGMNELDTTSLENVDACFDGCRKITDNSMCTDWDVSNVECWSSMFYNTPKLSSFDASKWRVVKTPTDAPTDCPFMFAGNSNYSPALRISVSESASINLKSTMFFDTHEADISGADGYWYDQATGDAYLPADIPSNKAATYVAVNSVMAPTVTIEGEAIYGSTLTAKVSGQPAGTTATSYQWQWSHDGKAWNDSQYANAKTDSITLVDNGVDDSPMHNYYRCVVTTTAGLKRVPQGVSAVMGPVTEGEALAAYSADGSSPNSPTKTFSLFGLLSDGIDMLTDMLIGQGA